MAFRMETYGASLVQTCKPTGTQSIMRPEAPFIKSISLGLFENRKPLETGAFERFFMSLRTVRFAVFRNFRYRPNSLIFRAFSIADFLIKSPFHCAKARIFKVLRSMWIEKDPKAFRL